MRNQEKFKYIYIYIPYQVLIRNVGEDETILNVGWSVLFDDFESNL